jgi:hypothetical protein
MTTKMRGYVELTYIGAADADKGGLDLDLVRLALGFRHVGVDAKVAGTVIAERSHGCLLAGSQA